MHYNVIKLYAALFLWQFCHTDYKHVTILQLTHLGICFISWCCRRNCPWLLCCTFLFILRFQLTFWVNVWVVRALWRISMFWSHMAQHFWLLFTVEAACSAYITLETMLQITNCSNVTQERIPCQAFWKHQKLKFLYYQVLGWKILSLQEKK